MQVRNDRRAEKSPIINDEGWKGVGHGLASESEREVLRRTVQIVLQTSVQDKRENTKKEYAGKKKTAITSMNFSLPVPKVHSGKSSKATATG